MLLAKDKQPTLKEDIADFFLRSYPRPATLAGERRPGRKDRGDWNTERLVWSPDWNDWFATAWQGIEQVFRLQRTVRILTSGEIHHAVVYGISRLSFHQAPAPGILALGRDQWAMENRLHWRRDVRLGEDACQTRTGSPPSLLAQLNSAVLSLMDRMGVRNVPRQMRYVDAEYNQALDLVLTGQCSVYENGKALDTLLSTPISFLKRENDSANVIFASCLIRQSDQCGTCRLRGIVIHYESDLRFSENTPKTITAKDKVISNLHITGGEIRTLDVLLASSQSS